MAKIDDLISKIDNPDLRLRIEQELSKIQRQRKFGLVFEEHLPECTPLFDIPVKRGSTVALKTGKISENYVVTKIEANTAMCEKLDGEHTICEFAIDELVVVAQFGEPIYPFLQQIDTVQNAPDSDLWHTLIEADNYHALQLLVYLYAGQVDCIYIDPPYNTGARDWKYNNDYVDSSDQYRHSKWLSMMQKRLRIAKKLLNPKDSMLMITIDEKEYLHLGCLLEELFSEARISMISSVINPHGANRQGMFARVDEYVFFVFIGDAQLVPSSNDMLHEQTHKTVRWATLRRPDLASKRGSTKGGTAQFYPIYINKDSKIIEELGAPLSPEQDRRLVPDKNNCITVFPIKEDGTEMNWGLTREELQRRIDLGYVRVGGYNPKAEQPFAISYLQTGPIKEIENGDIPIIGYNDDGSIILGNYEKPTRPVSIWNQTSHSATEYGTNILRNIIGNRFSFPKSIYAVHDAINFCIANKPNALIIDFFAGSGTTLHAVNLLNAEDGGHRRCILVTNNEISDEESKTLTKQGYKPGDREWERLGIARYVTWPRTVCSIEGHDVNGEPLKGNYIGSEIPMADGFKANAIYFKLGFLDKTSVSLGREFARMLPMLWMKAGAQGVCPSVPENNVPDMLVYPENGFAVLNEESAFGAFVGEVNLHPEIDTVFIITDSELAYKDMIKHLNVKHTFQLYRDYLDNFRINQTR